jgi:hypothetical protein
LRFFRIIDKIIFDSADRSLPLILAGTESEVAEYRNLSKYQHLLQGTIPVNYTNDDNRCLFKAASALVWRELIMPEHEAAIDEYQRLSGANPSRVARDIKHIAEAAMQGRVDKLLARMSRQTADTIRDNTQEVQRLTFPDAKDSKRLNDVALNVWHSSGTIYNLLANEMPDGALMAARLRY